MVAAFLDDSRRLVAQLGEIDWEGLINIEARIDGVRLTKFERDAAMNAANQIVLLSQVSTRAIKELEESFRPSDFRFVASLLEASPMQEIVDMGLAILNDSDEDGLPDIRDEDNCAQINNPNLEDSDGNGIADECEPEQIG